MEFIVTNQVKTRAPKNKYEVVFDFSETEAKKVFKVEEIEKVKSWIKLFKEYKKKLEDDWNQWCNVELRFITDVSEEFQIGLNEDDITDVWTDHPEYEMLDIPEEITIFYYNEYGTKFNVKVKNE